jgi:hypothetical protein
MEPDIDWPWSGAVGGGTAPVSLKSIAAFWDEAAVAERAAARQRTPKPVIAPL